MSIKPGPKRTNEDGTPDKRQRVTPEKQKDHPDLKRKRPNYTALHLRP